MGAIFDAVQGCMVPCAEAKETLPLFLVATT